VPQKPQSAWQRQKVKRVARKAKRSLDEVAHDAGLTLSRTTRKLKGPARKLQTKLEQAKAPAKRRARRVERNVVSALESAGESITAAARKAKRRFVPLLCLVDEDRTFANFADRPRADMLAAMLLTRCGSGPVERRRRRPADPCRTTKTGLND